jgi:hypothetical protein
MYNKFFREVPFLTENNTILDDINATKQCVKIALTYSHFTKEQQQLIINALNEI